MSIFGSLFTAVSGLTLLAHPAHAQMSPQQWAAYQSHVQATQNRNAMQIHSMQAASNARIARTDIYDHQAIRNESWYVNPNSGRGQWVPNYGR